MFQEALSTKAERGPAFAHGPYSANPGCRVFVFKLHSGDIPQGGQRVRAWEDLPPTSLHILGSQFSPSSPCLHAEDLLTTLCDKDILQFIEVLKISDMVIKDVSWLLFI